MAKKKYQENPSREANIVIGGGLGVLLGGVLLGFPGALVGGGIGAVLGSERGDTRRRLSANPKGWVKVNRYSATFREGSRTTVSIPFIFSKNRADALRQIKRSYPCATEINLVLVGPTSVPPDMVDR
jgi:hypothetical protein